MCLTKLLFQSVTLKYLRLGALTELEEEDVVINTLKRPNDKNEVHTCYQYSKPAIVGLSFGSSFQHLSIMPQYESVDGSSG